MRIFDKCLCIAVIFMLFGSVALSQELPHSGGYRSGTLYYYFHIIKKDETLSRIAKIYNLSVNEILEVNTTISDPEKIIEGQKIKVPNYSHFIGKYPPEQWNFILYRVTKGDKLKSIAKNFRTEVDDIKNVNPGIENKPVVGSEIRVPVKKQSAIAQTQNPDIKDEKKNERKDEKKSERKSDKKEQEKQTGKNPALMFNWGNDDKKPEETVTYSNVDCAEYVYKPGMPLKISLIATLKNDDGTIDMQGSSFLGGALIAVNEMKNKGLTVVFNSFNLRNDNSIDRILNSPELRESNFIIAQTNIGNLHKLAVYARENRIYLVVPYESDARSLVENNPYVIQLYPSDDAILRKMISERYEEDVHPVLIKPEKPDSLMLLKYRTTLKNRFGTFKEQKHTMGSRDLEYKDIFDADKLNLIFVCPVAELSKNQSFVSDLISRLNLVKNRLNVYGNDRWQNFTIIDKSLYFNTNVRLIQPAFVDYSDEATKLFVQLYRKAYNNEPDRYAFLGYDVTYYFLAVLRKYGAEFKDCVSEFDSTLLQSRFKLGRNNINDGFVNEMCFMLEYNGGSIEIKRK